MQPTAASGDRNRREFHISREARDRYGVPEALFAVAGNVVLADFRAARELTHRINTRRPPERAVGAGELNAVGLIDEALHLVVADYRRRVDPRVMAAGLEHLERRFGRHAVDLMLSVFTDRFPPTAVYRGEATVPEYLAGATEGVAHREVALEELILLWLANANPAFARLRELFDDDPLRETTVYLECMRELRGYFGDRPSFDGSGRSLLEELERPMRAAPDSLEGQLAFIRREWAAVVGPVLVRLLTSLDLLAEERRPWFGPGPGPVELPTFEGLGGEPVAFSPDLDWMPRLVLLAKNVHVWLHQLGQRYGRTITTLDQIPDQELDRLAAWGFTGLWLIGVWERSRASATIKRLMGDQDAVASAYSLLDYRIADDLGGEGAYFDLRDRAWRRGIRMATDMVPNHVGIDSRWVIEHPDWFIGLDHPPFPAYSFNGQDLCDDERVGIYLEDHYWDRSDAAVVFRRADHWTGDARYIYHGNDGTSMPWNDTAQLDYTKAEVREAVIQTILHVARLSPIIRFDAAMTLTRRHYQRLWFPEPGSGGDIPSRAGQGMTRTAFDAAMPNEFWREVVDRIAAEAPDTLLLAEAFWLLEGYFVRSLGMHRVYNSAFMNMLRDERNADYRRLIHETLEFDPQILKRYVNFMSNPDERTAVDQFGTQDKYVGVATMMATLPGVPMFGHGQIEGLAEKYGMEFYRPRWDEHSNDDLVRRHERQIFPLLRRRGLFAEVDNFVLYDFVTGDGSVDDNVHAYSNRLGDDRALVVYHNRYGDTRGWLRRSGHGPDRSGLAEGLALGTDPARFLILRDASDGLEYLRACAELAGEGLYVELGAYQSHVFLDLREVSGEPYARLHAALAGRGVPSIADALAELELEPVLEPFKVVTAPDRVQLLIRMWRVGPEPAQRRRALADLEGDLAKLLEAVRGRAGGEGDAVVTAARIVRELEAALDLPAPLDGPLAAAGGGDEAPQRWPALIAWLLTRRLADVVADRSDATLVSRWFDDWLLGKILRRQLERLGMDRGVAEREVATVRLLLACGGWHTAEDRSEERLRRLLDRLLEDPAGRRFLGVNSWEGEVWFRAEAFDELEEWLLVVAAVESGGDPQAVESARSLLEQLHAAREASGFRVTALLGALASPAASRE